MHKSEYKQTERQRRKAEGWVRFECWIKPRWLKRLKAFLAELGEQ